MSRPGAPFMPAFGALESPYRPAAGMGGGRIAQGMVEARDLPRRRMSRRGCAAHKGLDSECLDDPPGLRRGAGGAVAPRGLTPASCDIGEVAYGRPAV